LGRARGSAGGAATAAEIMIVSMWMTRDLVTVEPQTPIVDAAALMASRRVRRLPVVKPHPDGAGLRLLGIVSAKDILHAYPSDVNPFAVLGPDIRMAPLTAGEIMSRNLLVTAPDSPIEDAARLMVENKIGSLPVVHGDHLAGLITESDIFRAFVGFFASPDPGARITFDLSTGEDVFGFVSQAARKLGLRVTSLISSRQHDLPVCVVRISGKAVQPFLDELWSSGHRVVNVVRFP
jgi:acetoin utilization protein AcuB